MMARVRDKPLSDMGFRGMSFLFTIRDAIRPRKNLLTEVGIEKGHHVLDFGCGPGGYTMVVSEMIGPGGKVYALDIHPLAIEKVRSRALNKGLKNIETILSDQKTFLDDESVDVVLLYDVFHMLGDPEGVLKEIHRVMKPNGILSMNDHHMKDGELVTRMEAIGLFKLDRMGEHTYTFSRVVRDD